MQAGVDTTMTGWVGEERHPADQLSLAETIRHECVETLAPSWPHGVEASRW